MYSGNFGRAHDAEIFINLARKLRSESNIRFAFSVRGHGVEKLRRMVVPEDENITFLDFAPEYRMEQRISAANIHLVSVRDGFHGIVAPSKFQGAIGIGRPILFSGDSGSAVATWVREHSLGWIVDNDNIETVAARLKSLANSPDELETLNKHCCRTYTAHFSKKIVIDRLHSALSAMVHSAEGGKKL
jgi:glycosyltransferase involved in cell wall biosynthesis